MGLRKLSSSSGGGYDGSSRVKAKRLKESPLSIDVGLALPALAWSRKWTEKTNLVLGNVQKSHLNGWCYEIRKFFSLTGLIVWFSSSFSKTNRSFVGIEAIRSTRLRDFLVFTAFPFIDKEIDSLFHFFSALLL